MKIKKRKLLGGIFDMLFKKQLGKPKAAAVILAAGSGSRMGSTSGTKQWIELCGLPAVARSAKAFQECREIKEIIIVAKEDELEKYADFAEKYGISKLKKVVKGGDTRQSSALEGFKRISDNITHVAIHDAARCLVTPEMIKNVISAAVADGAAIAACKSPDTVKLAVDNRTLVERTPERSNVWLAQTPQVFETEIYRASAYTALENGTPVTDDASMAENAGFKVRLVDCGRENLKITEPLDVIIAEGILKERERLSAAADKTDKTGEKR